MRTPGSQAKALHIWEGVHGSIEDGSLRHLPKLYASALQCPGLQKACSVGPPREGPAEALARLLARARERLRGMFFGLFPSLTLFGALPLPGKLPDVALQRGGHLQI